MTETRNVCIVKYVGHKLLKDVWAVLKVILKFVVICVGIGLALVGGAFALVYAWNMYGAGGVAEAIAWVVTITYVIGAAFWAHNDRELPAAIIFMAGVCVALILLLISSSPVPQPKTIYTIQMAICFGTGPVIGVGRYFKTSIGEAIAYCDKKLGIVRQENT
jgi:hypothetical protein